LPGPDENRAAHPDAPVVTFDLFSALINSRSGGAAAFDRIGSMRDWRVTGADVYDGWDLRNKEAQRACSGWVPYVDLARAALVDTYVALGLNGHPGEDLDAVLATLPDWPLWPDVEQALPELGRKYRLGLLSNVDDELFRRTRALSYIDLGLAMTSERLRMYKPDRRIYLDADAAVGPIVHVATSARDVRGAVEAGIAVVRLQRPGHHLDPEGPRPSYEAAGIADLLECVDRVLAEQNQPRPRRR